MEKYLDRDPLQSLPSLREEGAIMGDRYPPGPLGGKKAS
jgi:hypothetical protein